MTAAQSHQAEKLGPRPAPLMVDHHANTDREMAAHIPHTAAQLRDMLALLPADDRDTWVKYGMALKRWGTAAPGSPDQAFAIWDEWSHKSASYEAEAMQTQWDSFDVTTPVPSPVTTASIHAAALGAGWQGVESEATPLTDEELEAAAKARADALAKEQRKAERREAAHDRVVAYFDTSIRSLDPRTARRASAEHPYLVRKRIGAAGAFVFERAVEEIADLLEFPPKVGGVPLVGRLLVLPFFRLDENARFGEKPVFSGLSLIDEEGRKYITPGATARGAFAYAGGRLPRDPAYAGPLFIGEGFATVRSVYEATQHFAVCVPGGSGQLGAVAESFRARYPAAQIVVLADLGNGEKEAARAADCVGGRCARPDFPTGTDAARNDFNDLHALMGHDAVREQVGAALARTLSKTDTSTVQVNGGTKGEWPDPQTLVSVERCEPYPIDALPELIRAAVAEVQGFTKAPMPLVVSSALGAISLAMQAHYDAQRAERLAGPVGLYLLTLADSGERKSTVDGFFTQAIRAYEENEAEIAKPLIANFKALSEAWEAKRLGVKDKLRQLAKKGQSTRDSETALRRLEDEKPEAPKIPRLLYNDATPEALGFSLMHHWPSGGIVSAEAGSVFGGHSMGKDSIMRTLSLLNVLWDGGTTRIDRRTSESFTVKGARLTVSLQIQAPTLRDFLARSGDLARGSGFLARFLIAWPESTQGTRTYTEAPANWPALEAFNKRMGAILDQSVPITQEGTLEPAQLTLSPEAKELWIAFHDMIEGELASGGELQTIRDVASKVADNAVRVSALFHVFEGGAGPISAEAFTAASWIVTWHLNESKRFFGELALPQEQADAGRLDAWLIERCRKTATQQISTRDAQRLSPVRDKQSLATALQELEELDRVRVIQETRRKIVTVNPALLEGKS